MGILIILLIISLVLAGGFLGVFLWAVRSGQFDDNVTPAVRILIDDTDDGSDNGSSGEDLQRGDEESR